MTMTMTMTMTEQEQRDRVCSEARRWLGTPYHHQADVLGAGVDCGMLLVRVFNAAGMIPAIDPRPYPHDWHLHRDSERYLGWLEQYALPADEPHPGDVIVWKFGRTYSHGAIYLGNRQIVHAYLGLGCVLGTLDDAPMAGRPVRYYSLFMGGEG